MNGRVPNSSHHQVCSVAAYIEQELMLHNRHLLTTMQATTLTNLNLYQQHFELAEEAGRPFSNRPASESQYEYSQHIVSNFS